MSRVQPRDISPFLQNLRNFLLGRKHTTALRFEQFVASRSPPPPVIPDGPCHNIRDNYYCKRDGRREVAPPKLVSPVTGALKPGPAADPCKDPSNSKKLPLPGSVYKWD